MMMKNFSYVSIVRVPEEMDEILVRMGKQQVKTDKKRTALTKEMKTLKRERIYELPVKMTQHEFELWVNRDKPKYREEREKLDEMIEEVKQEYATAPIEKEVTA